MTECGQTDDVLDKCIKDVLSVIKPVEKNQNLRLDAIQELKDSISSVETLRVEAVSPFGSFVSNLYAKSGDLDVSIELWNDSNLPTSRNKKQHVLREVWMALQTKDIPRDVQFTPTARAPILQYVSNNVGISCDVSVDNCPGRIKSKVFYWINTLDGRFVHMVLLIKEWAKSQGTNDPKNGTLNSYSLCLLVVFHFQTCKPAILPALKEIYDVNIPEDTAANHSEKLLDEVCEANIEKFRLQNTGQRNQSSLSHLLATFFEKFSRTDTFPTVVISTFEGRLMRIQDMPSLIVEDPFERPGNAARAVTREEIDCITRAFNRAKSVFILDGHRNELRSLLCTPEVGKILGVKAVANPYTYPSISRFPGSVAAKSYDKQCRQQAQGLTRIRPIHNTQRYNSGRQAAEPCQSKKRREECTLDRQANRHAVTTGYEPARGWLFNDSAKGSQSQGSSSSQHGNGNRHHHNLTTTDGRRISRDHLHLSNDDIDMLQFLSILEEELEEEKDHPHH